MIDKRIAGPLAESKVITVLIKEGFSVFTQFTGKESFDMVAYKDRKIYRIQVKSTQRKKNGSWLIVLKTSYLKSSGESVIKSFDKRDSDILAVYIFEIDRVCFIKSVDVNQRSQLSIRAEYSKKSRSNLLLEDIKGMEAFNEI